MTLFSRLNFPNLLFIIFIWLRLVEYLILRVLVIHCESFTSFEPTVKSLLKLKNCSTSYLTTTRFFHFWTNFILFLSLYRRKCQYRRKCPLSPIFFGKKRSSILAPMYIGNSTKSVFNEVFIVHSKWLCGLMNLFFVIIINEVHYF